MAEVVRTLNLDASAADVWAVIGDFQSLDSWHPAVATSEDISTGGDNLRKLTTGDGAVIIEKLVDSGPATYSYAITDSPIPVENYVSKIEVADSGSGCVVTWSSTFEPKADVAEGIIAGIYEAGFGALTGKFA